MVAPTSEPDRPAPEALSLLQDFLNTPIVEPTAQELAMADAIRADSGRGEAQATLAARYGVGQQLVSAILRRKRLAAAPGTEEDQRILSLGTPAAAAAWLESAGYLGPGANLSAADHAALLHLHRLLLALALSNNGEPLAPQVLPQLDALAESHPSTVKFGAPRPRLVASGSGSAAFIATVLASVYDAMRDGAWERLKACPADHCQHVFYDTSRNRTSTWCSMAICGNRTKVRKYQQRRREVHTA